MVVGTLRIPVSSEGRLQVLEVLQSIQGPVLAEPGCAAFNIYEESPPDQAVVLVERWKSEEALELHIRSEAYLRILNAIEISACPPEVCFDYVSHSEGIELIERMRELGNATWTSILTSSGETTDPRQSREVAGERRKKPG